LKGQFIHFTPDVVFPGDGFEEISIAARTFQFLVLLCGKTPLTVPNCLIEHGVRHAAAKLNDFRRRKAYSLIQRPLHQTRSNLLIEEFSLAISTTSAEEVKSVSDDIRLICVLSAQFPNRS